MLSPLRLSLICSFLMLYSFTCLTFSHRSLAQHTHARTHSNISQLIISAIKSFYDKLLQSRMSEKRCAWGGNENLIKANRKEDKKKMLINWNKINNNKRQICCFSVSLCHRSCSYWTKSKRVCTMRRSRCRRRRG